MAKGFWKNHNVLVTGATGFIGGNLADKLVEEGASVYTIVHDLRPKNSLVLLGIDDKITKILGDIVDYDLVERVINKYSIDSVFHLAAQPIVGITNRSPRNTLKVNIEGSWNVFEAARVVGCVERIVTASSDKAYGDQKELPYKEDSRLLASYPYDASKACADILARAYAKTYHLPVAITRCANVYGRADLHLNRIVPGTILWVLRGETPVIRSDGTLEREYMYVSDAVNAYLTLAENIDQKGLAGEAFNFGTGVPTTVLELFELIIKICGKNVKPKILDQVKNEIQSQYMDSGKAKKTLGWEAKVSLEDGIRRTVDWYREHLYLL